MILMIVMVTVTTTPPTSNINILILFKWNSMRNAYPWPIILFEWKQNYFENGKTLVVFVSVIY